MKKIFFFIFVMMCVSYSTFAQETVKVPIESIKSFWVDTPSNSSSYEWSIVNNGGAIISGQNTDKIFVEFDDTEGISTISVREINQGGCVGEKSFINILRFEGPNATIAIIGETTLCYDNTGSNVILNFTGTPPFLLNYKKNNLSLSLTSSQMQYTIPAITLTETTIYELISITDANQEETPLTSSATITVLPKLNPLIIRHD